MTFYTYMTRNYRDATGPKSDLARDMFEDREDFPRNGVGKYDGWHKLILKYLLDNGACIECLDVFEDSWDEYVRHERARKKR